jgi:signal transduction histidine kinase
MMTTWRSYLRAHPRTADGALALLLLAASFTGNRFSFPGAATPPSWWPGMLLVGASCLALTRRRTHPRATAALTAASAIAVTALGYMPTVLLLGPAVVAFYALADRVDRKTANTIALTAIVLLTGTAVLVSPHETVDLTVVAPAACLLLPVALGTTTRLLRANLEAVQARAEYAEHTREEEARRRVAEERMRIARELHDVVAHHLSLANAQAGTAAHLARTRPDQADEILASLADTLSSALRELKATVGLLRESDDPDAPLHPSPGLAILPELTASLASTGLAVTVTTSGEPCQLSPGIDLTAFRIVQEALTNVTKHAATKTAHVHLAYSREQLTISVTDDAHAGAPKPTAPESAAPESAASKPAAPGGGFGLIGMRERVQSVGGRLRAGPRSEGGFAVTAELPLHPRP